MKLRFTILIFSVLLFSIDGLKSQSINTISPVLPLKSTNSVLFGKDIIMNNQPDQDQRNVAICSAFNGWLYSANSYFDAIDGDPVFTIIKSIDNGITWTVISDLIMPLQFNKCKSIDLAVIGDSITNLKVIFAGLFSDASTVDLGLAIVWSFNGETGDYEDQLFIQNSIYDIALATDFNYPALNSNPHSLGVLYSKWSANRDSIIFRSSSNGGMSLGSWHVVATSTKRYHKVALAYGRSASYNSGRYFAAWQEQDQTISNLGHIYTAHTNPDFNSPFTTPVNLDSLIPSNINMCRNPAIACQYNNVDNDSSNLTEVVLFDKYISSQNSYGIDGFYNKTATTSNHFTPFTLNLSSNSRQQSSIAFNPFENTFMVTYYDSTTQKLPFLKNDFNLTNANSWEYVSSGYNDSSNLAAPYPKVALNMGQQKGANVWSAERAGGNGIAMFDAPYSTYTGIPGNNKPNDDRLFGAYPNPCKDVTNIGVELKKPGKVNITLYDLYGQSVGILTDQYYSSGKHYLRIDVSFFPSGTYIYKFQTSAYIASGKLMMVK